MSRKFLEKYKQSKKCTLVEKVFRKAQTGQKMQSSSQIFQKSTNRAKNVLMLRNFLEKYKQSKK